MDSIPSYYHKSSEIGFSELYRNMLKECAGRNFRYLIKSTTYNILRNHFDNIYRNFSNYMELEIFIPESSRNSDWYECAYIFGNTLEHKLQELPILNVIRSDVPEMNDETIEDYNIYQTFSLITKECLENKRFDKLILKCHKILPEIPLYIEVLAV